MVSKSEEERLRDILTNKWNEKFFGTETITDVENNRSIERANANFKVNGAMMLYNRIKGYNRILGRIDLGAVTFEVQTRNTDEKKKWLREFGPHFRMFRDFLIQFDLSISVMKVRGHQNYFQLKIVAMMKQKDEGFVGGWCHIQFEDERLREERRVKKLKNQENAIRP